MIKARAFLSLTLFIALSFAQVPGLRASVLDELPGIADVLVPEVPAPLAEETFPDYEQDRKPAFLVSASGGERVIGGVRFERLPDTGLYSWREVSFADQDLKEVYWGYRSGGTGHIFILFTFNSEKTPAIVIEALPWKKKGEAFKPFTAGVSGHYPLVWNVVEWNSFLETSVGVDALRIDIYPMKLDRAEKLRMLDEAVKEAVRDLDGEKYHTFLNSCSSNALKVFKNATGHRLLIGRMLPTVVIKHMKLRGFLGKRQSFDTSNWNN